jgi:hypothetical protein
MEHRHLRGWPLNLLGDDPVLPICETRIFRASIPSLLIPPKGTAYWPHQLTWTAAPYLTLRRLSWFPRGAGLAELVILEDGAVSLEHTAFLDLEAWPNVHRFEVRPALKPPVFEAQISNEGGAPLRLRELSLWLDRGDEPAR